MELIINKNFKTNTNITSRTLQIAEAFGLGIDEEKVFNVCTDLHLNITKHDIVYITGDSGSGKSVLLKELKEKIKNYTSLEDIQINEQSSIIDLIGKDTNDALYCLSLVGLSDAFICLRKFNELSDGQKYRFKLAKMIENNEETIFADEFCALLDRDTAKIIAHNFQKVCRKLHKTLIVATTHTDLLEDLNPNVYIYKKYEDEVKIEYLEYIKKDCSIINNIYIEEGSLQDYYALEKFHYRNGKFAGHFKTYRMLYQDELIGEISFVYPPLALKGRNTYTDRYKKTSSEVAKLINKELKMVSRIIIHPKYRGVGLAVKLLKHTMPLTNQKYIELLAVMGKFNPFAEKAEMKKVDYEAIVKYKKIQAILVDNGFDLFMCNSSKYVCEKLNGISEENKIKITDMVKSKIIAEFKGISAKRGKSLESRLNKETTDEDIASLIKECLPKERNYYIWENSNYAE